MSAPYPQFRPRASCKELRAGPIAVYAVLLLTLGPFKPDWVAPAKMSGAPANTGRQITIFVLDRLNIINMFCFLLFFLIFWRMLIFPFDF